MPYCTVTNSWSTRMRVGFSQVQLIALFPLTAPGPESPLSRMPGAGLGEIFSLRLPSQQGQHHSWRGQSQGKGCMQLPHLLGYFALRQAQRCELGSMGQRGPPRRLPPIPGNSSKKGKTRPRGCSSGGHGEGPAPPHACQGYQLALSRWPVSKNAG